MRHDRVLRRRAAGPQDLGAHPSGGPGGQRRGPGTTAGRSDRHVQAPLVERRYLHKSGATVWALLSVAVVRDPARPTPRASSGSCWTSASSGAPSRSWSGKTALLATQQEASLDAILMVDEAGRIVSFNERFLDMWGHRPGGGARRRRRDRSCRRLVARMQGPGGVPGEGPGLSTGTGRREEPRRAADARRKDDRALLRARDRPERLLHRPHLVLPRHLGAPARPRSGCARASCASARWRRRSARCSGWPRPNASSMALREPRLRDDLGPVSCDELYADPQPLAVQADRSGTTLAWSVVRALEALGSEGAPYDVEYRIMRPDGAGRWINDRGYPLRERPRPGGDDLGRRVRHHEAQAGRRRRSACRPRPSRASPTP